MKFVYTHTHTPTHPHTHRRPPAGPGLLIVDCEKFRSRQKWLNQAILAIFFTFSNKNWLDSAILAVTITKISFWLLIEKLKEWHLIFLHKMILYL